MKTSFKSKGARPLLIKNFFSKRGLAPFGLVVMMVAFGTSAQAANYDLKETTPEVRQALSGRQARYSEIQRLKSEAQIGEDHQGYVLARTNAAQVAGLIASENKDRRTIYQAIVAQNGLGEAGMRQVEETFGEVQRGKARPGDWIQDRGGRWFQK